MYGLDEPKVIKSEVFATLPPKFRVNKAGVPDRKNGGTTLEGPSFDRNGNLFITDIPNGRVYKITPAGTVSQVVEYDGEPNGLRFHKDGRIFIADHRHGLMLLDEGAGKIETFCEGFEKERFKGVNDLSFASNGDLYFTDQGATGLHDPTGRVYRMDVPTKRLSVLINNVPSPNGVVLNHDESAVFVAATRSSAVWNLPLSHTGMIVKAGLFARLPCEGPDGMAVDTDGNLAVAHPFLGVVWLFEKRGLPIARVDSCTGTRVTNIAYGGEENRWLYMVEGDTYSIMRAKMPRPGRVLFSHQ